MIKLSGYKGPMRIMTSEELRAQYANITRLAHGGGG